jgi:peptidyl-prolyl cis-trans isomerase SurA
VRFCLILTQVLLIITSLPAYGDLIGSQGRPDGRTIDRVIARVGSEPVTLLEVQSLQAADPDITYSAALDLLIDQRLVLSWARSNSVTVSQKEIERTERAVMEGNNIPEDRFDELLASRGQDRETFRDGLRDQIMVNKALSQALEPAMRIDDEEIEKRYKELYPPRRTFTIRHILLKPDTSGAENEVSVGELAAQIMDRIRKGAPFEDMALEYSADRVSAVEGGFLGSFREGELLPELEKLALELEPGDLGGPVRTSMGFHILKLEGKSLTEPPPLSQVRDGIRADLISRREPEVREQWLKELREKAFIEIFADE